MMLDLTYSLTKFQTRADWRNPFSTSEGQMEISKLEAAKRQLDCAVRLFLNDDDMSSIITLSRAAFRLSWDIYPIIANDGFEQPFSKVIEHIGWANFNAIANFLKHADKDPEAQWSRTKSTPRLG
jgi:hypothetical protein